VRNAEGEVRSAFASGEFALAGAAWERYAAELDAAIRRGAATAADLQAAAALTKWARLVVKCFRAESEARIAEARGVLAYSRGAPSEQRLRASF
jgi:hypothetical protein